MSDKTIVYGVVLFHTSSAALRAEKILLKGGRTVRLIPPPREFSSDCGVSLQFDCGDERSIRTLLDSANVEISSIHRLR
jgi:hypothetical protein